MIRKIRETSRARWHSDTESASSSPAPHLPITARADAHARLSLPRLLAIVAAGGVVASLRLPWYGAGGTPTAAIGLDGPIERTLATLGRAVSATAGAAGWTALGSWAAPLAALAGLAALLAALCLAPARSCC
jgi:hypothetical protein